MIAILEIRTTRHQNNHEKQWHDILLITVFPVKIGNLF
jgi:hypothetical protein